MRTYQEVDVSPVSPSSTPGCESSRLEMERWKILHSAKDLGVGIGIEVLKIILIRQYYFKF